ncbi:hypothetical protein EK21DRAFT_93594 [Setomelanomma holmii]|uniref:Zn(2)-C6 fungal-type domain-containing protein n=1 Tax=Setomelanomma holmii TaxID=210430 RepID=A0A9P4LH38_9PLEO|nr:hypothetical protein EK21DRAFT_93594 [Setomelanomma holmii]
MPSDTPDDHQGDSNEQGAKESVSAADSLACNNCRKSKLRCSRDRPTCLHCRKTGHDCIYETKRIKPGLKSGAVENLHRRLDNLERRLDKQAVAHTSQTPCSQDKAIAARSGTTSGSAAYDVLAILAKELPKLLDPQGRQTATPASVSEPSNKRRRPDDSQETPPDNLHFDDAPVSPGLQLLEDIISAYFRNIHPWIPMMHKARFLHKVSSNVLFVPPAAELVSTLATRRERVVHAAMDCLSVESLQALIILAFDDIGNGRSTQAWSLIASLTRTVEYAQLAQEHEADANRPLCRPYTPLPSTENWTELEERRRVFWIVFMLDRYSSVTMGWNTSLTSDDVYRRLPCDGHLWRMQTPVRTPYLGIWDRSRGRIGNPIQYVSRCASPSQEVSDFKPRDQNRGVSSVATDMSTVGAMAYNIEATESMSRVMSYFLQQKLNINDPSDINAWLTRFKVLDLRLVHWKMLLPQRWKANPNLTRHVPLMDPNLTTAHITHNASTILLHQLIAYPPLHWAFCHKLPSSCSAEACYSTGIEIADSATSN